MLAKKCNASEIPDAPANARRIRTLPTVALGGSVKKLKSDMVATSNVAKAGFDPMSVLDSDPSTYFQTDPAERPYLQIDMTEALPVIATEVTFDLTGRTQYSNGDIYVYYMRTSGDYDGTNANGNFESNHCCVSTFHRTDPMDATTRYAKKTHT